MRGKRVIVVCGYGTYLTEEIEGYLKKVKVRADRESQKGDLYLITTGGETLPEDNPGMTEAGMMADYLQGELELQRNIILEDESDTTQENLLRSLEIKENKFQDLSEVYVVIFCGGFRAREVRKTAEDFLPADIEFEIVPYPVEKRRFPDIIKEWIRAKGSYILYRWGPKGQEIKKKARSRLYGERKREKSEDEEVKAGEENGSINYNKWGAQ